MGLGNKERALESVPLKGALQDRAGSPGLYHIVPVFVALRWRA